jgi:hypothetical protein
LSESTYGSCCHTRQGAWGPLPAVSTAAVTVREFRVIRARVTWLGGPWRRPAGRPLAPAAVSLHRPSRLPARDGCPNKCAASSTKPRLPHNTFPRSLHPGDPGRAIPGWRGWGTVQVGLQLAAATPADGWWRASGARWGVQACGRGTPRRQRRHGEAGCLACRRGSVARTAAVPNTSRSGAGPCTLHAHYAHYAHFSNLAIPLKNKLQGFNPENGGME